MCQRGAIPFCLTKTRGAQEGDRREDLAGNVSSPSKALTLYSHHVLDGREGGWAHSRPGIPNITSGSGTAQISQKQTSVAEKKKKKNNFKYESTAILLNPFLSPQVVTVTKGEYTDEAMSYFSVLQI